MKREPNPAPRIDSSEIAKNAIAFEEFAGQPPFTGAQVKTAKLVQPILPLPVTALLLF